MIYVISHKPNDPKIYGKDYKILYVGDLYDSSQCKDNINYLNPYINELSGLYYMWKNLSINYTIGLAHYRRVFATDDFYNMMSIEDAEKILYDNGYDIIVTPIYTVPKSIIEWLRVEMKTPENIKVLNKYYDILCDKIPGIRDYFEHTTKFNPKNMFICHKLVMDDFCDWLFPIIIPIAEQFMKEDLQNVTEPRMLAFLFERILTFYIRDKHLKPYEAHIIENLDW